MSDPILDAILENSPEWMFGEESETASNLYGLGVHRDVVLTDVETYGKSDKGFGYRLGLKVALKENMPYMIRVDLAQTLEANGHEIEDWMQKRQDKRAKFTNEALKALGFNRELTKPIDDDMAYDAVVNVFRQLIGNAFTCKIAEDGKNVKDESAEHGWRFEPNGFTKCVWMRPQRVKK